MARWLATLACGANKRTIESGEERLPKESDSLYPEDISQEEGYCDAIPWLNINKR